jgi:hypothetical protein
MQGEDFTIEPPRALTVDHGGRLTPEERRERMRKVRKELGI